MILELVLKAIFSVLRTLMHLFPSAEQMPQAIADAVDFIEPYFQKANSIFPVDTLFTAIALILAIEGGLLLFKAIDYIFKRIRG